MNLTVHTKNQLVSRREKPVTIRKTSSLM